MSRSYFFDDPELKIGRCKNRIKALIETIKEASMKIKHEKSLLKEHEAEMKERDDKKVNIVNSIYSLDNLLHSTGVEIKTWTIINAKPEQDYWFDLEVLNNNEEGFKLFLDRMYAFGKSVGSEAYYKVKDIEQIIKVQVYVYPENIVRFDKTFREFLKKKGSSVYDEYVNTGGMPEFGETKSEIYDSMVSIERFKDIQKTIEIYGEIEEGEFVNG